jgi:hypothetical protein
MSPAVQKLIELDKKKVDVKAFFEEYKAAVEAVVTELGVGGHFQDGEGTVYQTVIPEGRFVAFDKFSVQRTRREGEKRGDLSLTKARDLGYEVE